MPAIKGAPSNNPKGKPKGTPNKGTERARWAIAAFVDGNAGRLGGWLDQIAKKDPKAAFAAFMSVVEFHIPKLQRSEVDMNVTNDLDAVPTAHINILIQNLRESLEHDGLTAAKAMLIDQPASEANAPAISPIDTQIMNLSALAEPYNHMAREPESLIGIQPDSPRDYVTDRPLDLSIDSLLDAKAISPVRAREVISDETKARGEQVREPDRLTDYQDVERGNSVAREPKKSLEGQKSFEANRVTAPPANRRTGPILSNDEGESRREIGRTSENESSRKDESPGRIGAFHEGEEIRDISSLL